MKKLVNSLFFLLMVTSFLYGKEIKYKVADIPKELRENARSIVRNEEIEFEVKSINSAVQRVKYAISILNDNGIDDANFSQFYTKFSKISGISGKVYNEAGELVKRIPSDEIIDHSAISGFSLYEDSRGKFIDPKMRTLPFTVEYIYEINYDGYLIFPIWSPVRNFNISIENSEYKVINPTGNNIKILEINIPNAANISTNGKVDTHIWKVQNLKAYIYEPLSINIWEFIPSVTIIPENFKYGGYEGNQTTWENLGNWEYSLLKNKNDLSEEVQDKIKMLVKDIENDFDKIKKLYEYMQNKTRYVNVSIGIGGFEPFEASTVERLSYGDCKALTNYMKSLLEIVGINSFYTSVYGGDLPNTVIKNIPSEKYFNHVFLCIPVNNDTLWLECTNQRLPCGYIGDFTDDRDAFIIDKDNSKIVHTKAYTAKDNLEIRKTNVKLEGNGNGNAIVNTVYKGLNYEQILPIYIADDTDKKRKITNRINLPNFQLKNFSYKENRDIIPSFEERLDIDFTAYGTQMPPRMFFPVNFMNRFTNIPERVRNRKIDVYIRRPYVDIDTVVYEISEFYKIENIPSPIAIESKFGKYAANTEIKDNKLIYTRYFETWKGKYPPAAYAEFLEFLEKVAKADGSQCSLIKK